METFGERLRQLRKDKNIEQKTLASMLGKENNSIISNWENDRAKPSADDLVRLADILNTSIDYLLVGKQQVTYTQEPDLYKKLYELQEEVSKYQKKEIENLKNTATILN